MKNKLPMYGQSYPHNVDGTIIGIDINGLRQTLTKSFPVSSYQPQKRRKARSNIYLQIFLCTKLANTYKNCSRLTPRTMASTNTVVAPTYRVLHGRNWLPMVLVGCCMPWHRLGGTNAAMGQQGPPWLRNASCSSFC